MNITVLFDMLYVPRNRFEGCFRDEENDENS